MTLIGGIKERFSPSATTRIEAGLRLQPFIREFWLAEDYALETIITNVNDGDLNRQITDIAQRSFNLLKQSGRVPVNQEDQYRSLCLRNARRTVWLAHDGLQEELGDHFVRLWEEGMKKMEVYDRFRVKYVKDGKSSFITINPDKPYF